MMIKRKSQWRIIIAIQRLPISGLLILGLVLCLLAPTSTFANIIEFDPLSPDAWLDPDWSHRHTVTISNPGAELTDYQVMIALDSSPSFDFAQAQADGSDVRVTDSSGVSLLPFWIEEWSEVDDLARIWTQVPSLPTGDTTIYVYYGNPTTTSVSNGFNTFDAYDGYEGNEVGSIPESPTSETWSKYAGNPVMDCSRCGFGSTFYDSVTGIYHNFVSWTNILHYTSPDGINWTADDANNPVLTASQPWEGSNVGVPMAWKEGSTWYMLYRGGSPDKIGLATSTDAVTWVKSGENPVLEGDPGEWDDRDLDPWGVIKVGSTYYLWYNTIGAAPGLGRATGLATSTNLTDWTKDPNNPIFTGGRFCAFPFKYDGDYYLLIPHYTSGSDYSQHELYRDSNPTFYPSEREYLGIAINYGPTDWDDHDQDTPAVLTDDIYRDTFSAAGNQLWVYYAGEGGDGSWRTGMVIEEDIAAAIAGVQTSPLTWTASANITVVDTPVHQGIRSVQHTNATQFTGTFPSMERGVVGAWMRRASTSAGDYDIYLYGGGTLSAVAGLGRNGDFHFWNGSFQPTGVLWSTNTWYLVTLAFDTNTDQYDFVVYDGGLNEIVRVENISFGNSGTFIDRGMLYTSSAYTGLAFGDDFRVRKWASVEPTVSISAPTAVTMASFQATPFVGAIQVNWETLLEIDLLGFNIYRSETLGGERVRLNDQIIPAVGLGGLWGAEYSFIDQTAQPGVEYYYWLELIEVDHVAWYQDFALIIAPFNRFFPFTVVKP